MQVTSSLISEVDWKDGELYIKFRNNFPAAELTYVNVPPNYFEEMINAKSIGNFYNSLIKKHFKTKAMADQEVQKKNKPKGINKSNPKGKRFLKLSIDTKKINKDWIVIGEKGNYLNLTLMMLPDGEVDRYECLGMIVQDVPEKVRKADSTIKGPILGNGMEYQWESSAVTPADTANGTTMGEANASGTADPMDDLPF